MSGTALVTMYAGEAEVLRDLTMPTFERYSDRHGFDLIEANPGDGSSPHLGKVTALRCALEDHDLAIWVDADAVIFDDAPGLAQWMPEAARMFFAQDRRLAYGINTWLLGLRSGRDTQRFLDRVEEKGRTLTEPPWDLRAVQQTLDEFPEHQLRMVVTPTGWQGPQGHFQHEGVGGGLPPYTERVCRLEEALNCRVRA